MDPNLSNRSPKQASSEGRTSLHVWRLVTALEGLDDREEVARLALAGLDELVPAALTALHRPSAPRPWVARREGRILRPAETDEWTTDLSRLRDQLSGPDGPSAVRVRSRPGGRDEARAWRRLGLHRAAAAPLRTVTGDHGTLVAGRAGPTSFTAVERQHLGRAAAYLALRLAPG